MPNISIQHLDYFRNHFLNLAMILGHKELENVLYLWV